MEKGQRGFFFKKTHDNQVAFQRGIPQQSLIIYSQTRGKDTGILYNYPDHRIKLSMWREALCFVCKMLSHKMHPKQRGELVYLDKTHPKQRNMKQEQEYLKTQTSPESYDHFKWTMNMYQLSNPISLYVPLPYIPIFLVSLHSPLGLWLLFAA